MRSQVNKVYLSVSSWWQNDLWFYFEEAFFVYLGGEKLWDEEEEKMESSFFLKLCMKQYVL